MHAMLDIETLGTTADAPVLSAAVVFFDPQTGNTFEQAKFVFDVRQQKNRPINFDTMKWWMTQSSKAREHWMNPQEYNSLEQFAAFCSKYEKVTWWANSPAFDEVIMSSLLRQAEVRIPWSFWEWRDVRTLRNFLFDKTKPNNKNAHDPLADCLAQIELVHRFYVEQAMVSALHEY